MVEMSLVYSNNVSATQTEGLQHEINATGRALTKTRNTKEQIDEFYIDMNTYDWICQVLCYFSQHFAAKVRDNVKGDQSH